MATSVHGFWRSVGAAGRRSHDRRGVAPRGGSTPIGRFETLEARVLLNADVHAGNVGDPRQPAPPAFFFVVPPSRSEFAVAGESTGESVSAPLTPANVVDPRVAVAGSTAFDSISGPIPPAMRAQAEAIRPLIRSSSIDLQDADGNTRSSDDDPTGATFAGEFLPQAPGTSLTSPKTTPSGPPSPEELDALPRSAWTRSYSYAGTIGADKDSVSFRIPVGPASHTLTVDVRSGVDGQLLTPKIDQVYLIGSHGEMLAAISGVKFMSNGSEQVLYVSLHGAPVGGELFMRLVRGDDASSTQVGDEGDSSNPSSSVQVPSSWGPVDYQISILRTDAASKSGASTGVSWSGGPTYITTLPTPIGGSTSVTPSPSYNSGTAEPALDTASASRVGEGVPSKEDGGELTSLEEEAPPVYLGPLVSRTAAPLGPVLATYAGDPAPPVSRGDRPAGDVLDAVGAELDIDLLLNLRSRRAASRDASHREDGSALAELRGGGGVPILLAGIQPIDARLEAAALAATIGRDVEPEEFLADAVDGSPRDRKAEVARAGLATRAVGFLIGLGLASGPLYPDLVALARRKRFRGSRSLRPKARRGGGS